MKVGRAAVRSVQCSECLPDGSFECLFDSEAWRGLVLSSVAAGCRAWWTSPPRERKRAGKCRLQPPGLVLLLFGFLGLLEPGWLGIRWRQEQPFFVVGR